MSNLYSQQSEAAGRDIMPDLVRAFALIGIVLVNVGAIGHNINTSYAEVSIISGVDKAAYFSVASLFLMKSYTLFSFMFGAGLAYQMQAAERKARPLAPQYFRRMFGLLILGLAHVYFAYVGDILVIYAVLGCLLFAFKTVSAKALWRLAIVIYSIGAALMLLCMGLILLMQAIDPSLINEIDAEMVPMVLADREAFTSSNFFIAASHRMTVYFSDILIAGLIQGLFAFALFLAGLSCVKQGLIATPDAPVWAKCRKWGFVIGLPLSLACGYFAIQNTNFFVNMLLTMTFSFIAAPFMTMGYLGWIAKWSAAPITPLKAFIARGGTSSLTAYLLQSLILSYIFCGYGLGYYEKIGAAGTIIIALTVGIFTIAFSSLWRKYFALGPFEYVLRGWTYLGKR